MPEAYPWDYTSEGGPGCSGSHQHSQEQNGKIEGESIFSINIKVIKLHSAKFCDRACYAAVEGDFQLMKYPESALYSTDCCPPYKSPHRSPHGEDPRSGAGVLKVSLNQLAMLASQEKDGQHWLHA